MKYKNNSSRKNVSNKVRLQGNNKNFYKNLAFKVRLPDANPEQYNWIIDALFLQLFSDAQWDSDSDIPAGK